MVAERLGRLAARLVTKAEPAAAKVRATEFAQRLKAEYERGLIDEQQTAQSADAASSGEPTNEPTGSGASASTTATPPEPGSTAPGSTGDSATTDGTTAGSATTADRTSGPTETDDVSTVTAALRSVDWAKVRATTTEMATETKDRIRDMAGDVDWGKVQAGAAVVSSALIAAVASGQIPLGGRLAGPIARAILNDSDLASRVSTSMGSDAQPPDLTDDVKP